MKRENVGVTMRVLLVCLTAMLTLACQVQGTTEDDNALAHDITHRFSEPNTQQASQEWVDPVLVREYHLDQK